MRLKLERFGLPNKPSGTPECPEGSFRCAGGGREANLRRGEPRGGAPIHPMIYHSRVVRMTRPRMRQGPVVRTMGV